MNALDALDPVAFVVSLIATLCDDDTITDVGTAIDAGHEQANYYRAERDRFWEQDESEWDRFDALATVTHVTTEFLDNFDGDGRWLADHYFLAGTLTEARRLGLQPDAWVMIAVLIADGLSVADAAEAAALLED